ncbi:MAG: hypothetical protein QOD26_3468 [Betaproteobacteria bacterium]|nr:hypothetical protein [Betaproteobacteria bacterium]
MTRNSQALGADLVIPALALAFASYFFFSTADLVWEAKANGVIIGTALVILIALLVGRVALRVMRGEGGLGLDPLWQPREMAWKRVGLVAVTALFIGLLPWLGLTLALWLGLLAQLWIIGVRRRAILFWLPTWTAAAVYALFIAVLDSGFPHGPIENLLAPLLALAGR